MDEHKLNRRQALRAAVVSAIASAVAGCKTKEEAEVAHQAKEKNVRLDLDSIGIDKYGRVIVNDPKLAAEIQKAKESGVEFVYLSANSGNYCVLPSGCPVTGQNVGCGCPKIETKE